MQMKLSLEKKSKVLKGIWSRRKKKYLKSYLQAIFYENYALANI